MEQHSTLRASSFSDFPNSLCKLVHDDLQNYSGRLRLDP